MTALLDAKVFAWPHGPSLGITLGEGDVLEVLGPNGGGKTTCLRRILQLGPQPDRVYLDGAPIRRAAALQVGAVIQGVGFSPQVKVKHIVAMVGRLREAGLIAELASWDLDLRKRVKSLSRGELARLYLAVAFAGKPRLLVLDEPFCNLDGSWTSALGARIERHVASGGACVISRPANSTTGAAAITRDQAILVDRAASVFVFA